MTHPLAAEHLLIDLNVLMDSAAERLRDPDERGVDVGVFIVRKFINSLGGKIELESAEGKGATFTVKIPCEN
jgi:signal transduction histidine kinase